jgi:glucokinase
MKTGLNIFLFILFHTFGVKCMKLYIGIDISGSKIIAGSVTKDGKIIKKERIPTPKDPKNGIEEIIKMTKHVSAGHEIIAIGAGCGSPLDWKNGIIKGPVHIPTWKNVHIGKVMKKEFGRPFFIDNDANVAVLAEKYFGSGKNHENIIYMNISTGVGAGIILNGVIYRGSEGYHPEIGHHNIEEGASLESKISATGIRKIYGKYPENLTKEEWNKVGESLGKGLVNVTLFYVPDIIILGGGISTGAGNRLLDPARNFMKKAGIIVKKPKIEVTKLGNDNCVLGAAALAMVNTDGI